MCCAFATYARQSLLQEMSQPSHWLATQLHGHLVLEVRRGLLILILLQILVRE